ncbi:cobaltochelatase subunit CobN [Pseudooceanicola sediminis]|uniref:Cobaltochelatase subunit CobN n=1 Tax=Pseudooceanicola sediminis TaxID=2211117 RepID=A0A399J3P8_9RHOB|nr:cobaltochelatase subunit CobN [Pseudooceanicola sediminis]KAA2313583.1 cobaltochelatase subunit CobN [Puniceibacterium sp. HSS470]RII38572.1 cobaltochelatase subunit CobN [Pseudooceanicola sediminis]|tara:strand:- start:31736 stop:35455 length:3720 start_codon:yes stop_codon:yes gene_type:complete
MHLLAATPGRIDDGVEPVDLGQTPADVVLISAADTELAALSQARAAMPGAPSLRLAQLSNLTHPMSVDLHLDDCATKSRLVIARVLGGTGYWRYGIEQFSARLHAAGVPFLALPGDDKPDPELRAFSTLPDADYDALWAYLVEGGPANATGFLHYCRALLDDTEKPHPAAPLLRAGLYWPGTSKPTLDTLQTHWTKDAATVPIVFYRALVQGAGLAPIDGLIRALQAEGLNPLPVFVASLKDPVSAATLDHLFAQTHPEAILNCTAFATGSPHGETGDHNPFAAASANNAPVFQVVLAASSEAAWVDGLSGLSARDIAMNVALPEIDGRILSRAISFKGQSHFDAATECPIAVYQARPDRIAFTARLAANWIRLRRAPAPDRRVALILANYPNKDGRLANGVGLDTPAATVHALNLLARNSYSVENIPTDSDTLMQAILAGPTNWLTDRAATTGGVTLALATYLHHFNALPGDIRQKITDRWGSPEDDPFFLREIHTPNGSATTSAPAGFKLSVLQHGNVVIGIQPARGYNIDPTETYHAPDLAPPHNYLAFYIWLRAEFGAHALVHMGKHGNLEWLPGKAVALSESCFPEAVFGPMPHIYPFIVNDPGEGTQAKRRTQAVIVDHLTPPLTRAESYGPLRDLEALVDEYYEAAGVDPRRIAHLSREILSLTSVTGVDKDAGFTGDADGDLAKLDAWLCELKEAQIRDGLHVFGQSPEGRLARDLLLALTRIPRGAGKGKDASLPRALAADFAMAFDPLDCDMAAPWAGPRPEALAQLDTDRWRSNGDTVERLELFAAALLDGRAQAPGDASRAVLDEITQTIAPMLSACGPDEGAGLLTALAGHFLAPAPSGAPTRGRLDTLPTGRNFYSVDSRAVPTPTAWALGWKSANLLIERHLQDQGDWPRTLLLTAWGTANMRTGGDDIAQALALMGVKPQWDAANRRVTGFEILPLTTLDRPRVDVTLRISGFFRDAFPQLIALVDSAARAVQALDEPDDMNPAAARARAGQAQSRVYGSKPGAYGAGLQAMIDERLWNDRSDLAEAYLEWGSYSYGASDEGTRDAAGLRARLTQTDGIVQNQDNREHDLLDSDDYYQFEGGAAAAVAALRGADVPLYHNDHSRPERPVIRTLDEELSRVIRSRVVNPKWIDGIKRHGYKGAFEIAATVDYLFAFAATTNAVKNHHFDLLEAAFLEDDATRQFIADHNAPALAEIAQRLQEAIERGLWTPRSNSARARIEALI